KERKETNVPDSSGHPDRYVPPLTCHTFMVNVSLGKQTGGWTVDKTYPIFSDITILPSHFPIFDAGVLPINAFVLKGKEPVLVDTGMGIDSEAFVDALLSVVDPPDLKWLWLTHDDADHTGSIKKIFEIFPNVRLATNSLTVLRMTTFWPVPMDRAYWLNPGDSLKLSDRILSAIRPPLFDNPATIGMYDSKSKSFFSADCFGGLIPSPVDSVDEIPKDRLLQGMVSWASGDCPWLHMIETKLFNEVLYKIRQLSPEIILSSHLPPAYGKTEQLLDFIATVPSSTPFVAPDQSTLQQILTRMKVNS
ncbi:MAG: MBL fold metallo-hydrolase, partial [Smithella sp.]